MTKTNVDPNEIFFRTFPPFRIFPQIIKNEDKKNSIHIDRNLTIGTPNNANPRATRLYTVYGQRIRDLGGSNRRIRRR